MCAGIALTGTVPSAGAKLGHHVLSPSRSLEFAVRGSNGYEIEVTGSGSKVEIWVGRPGGGLAKYRVPGRTRARSIEANIGSLGRIDLRFEARAVEPDSGGSKGCNGKPSLFEPGTFTGKVRFRGEGGYTRFSANRIDGWSWRSFRRVCKTPDWLLPDPGNSHKPVKETDEGTGREINAVGAAMSSHHRSVYVRFTSIVVPKRPGQRRLSLVGAKAEIHERRGRIAIERSDLTLADEGALLLGPASASPTATLTLPPPFSGNGIYGTAAGGTPTWSGSLRVRLPGATVALTGPDFVTALCQGGTLETVSDCMRPVNDEAARGPR